MEHHSAIKRNEILPFAATWIDLETVILSEYNKTETNSQIQRTNMWFPEGRGVHRWSKTEEGD